MKKCISVLSFLVLCLFANAQEMPMRHSTLGGDAWLSCNTAANPNPARAGNNHWISFDLGNVYALRKVFLWNYNHPDSLNMGFQSLYVDYKNELGEWFNLGNFQLDQAPGNSFYEGQNIADFMNKSVTEILITGVSNYGGSCYGLSEVRFEISNTALAVGIADPRLNCKTMDFSWQAKSEENIAKYVLQGSNDLRSWVNSNQLDASKSKKYNLEAKGSYVYYRLKIVEEDGVEDFSKVIYNPCEFSKPGLEAHPNPVQDLTVLKITDLSNLTGQISAYNELGQVVKTWNQQQLGNEVRLDMTELPTGQYFIVLGHLERNQVVPVTKL